MSETTARIAAAYEAAGPALTLGAVVHEGVADPAAQVRIALSMLNRHGLIAGATGTGKTKTLQLMAEQLSAQGVPVFATDVKGDLSGLAQAGEAGERVAQRSREVGDAGWAPTAFPVELFSLGGLGPGLPLRASLTSFGPILLAKVLDLNETQESALALIFHWADTNGLALLDLADLRAVIAHLTSPAGKAELEGLGGIARSTAGVILREVSQLVTQGADEFFGEPELDTQDLMRSVGPAGVISLLELTGVQDRPALFSTFVMWLLADLYGELPEVGDLEKPKLVFFFDEAHLLFTGASKDFLAAVVQTVRLVRSKGVSIFFVTQNPTDVPDDVLAQLGNRVQHALRAFTPADADALRKTVRTYPRTDDYDLEEALTGLGTGEAVVTVLSERGAPTPVAWCRMPAPRSRMAPADPATAERLVAGSPLHARYAERVDRESAYERLTAKVGGTADPVPDPPPDRVPYPDDLRAKGKRPRREPTLTDQIIASGALDSFARAAGSAIGRRIFGTARRRRRR